MDYSILEELKDRLNLAGISAPARFGLVIVIVLVAVIAAGRLIGTATASEFTLETHDGGTAQVEGQADERQPATVFAHISGEVVNPGLVELEDGARLADAIDAAGGFTENAAVDSVNLARVLGDGEQVIVAAKSQQGSSIEAQVEQDDTAKIASGLVNINTASEAELTALPGIGQATAVKIVEDRKANGSFKTIEEIKRVSGIGDKKFESLSGLICV